MPFINLTNDDKVDCLNVARESILNGFKNGKALQVVTSEYSAALQQQASSFVTLHKLGELRGCIGALEAYQPLIDDIADHAYAAAFQDPRFLALKETEYDELEIEISVLGPSELMKFKSEDDLLEQLRPNIDGLILEYDYHRGTFLPGVWEQLPDKKEFLNHLKVKAGLPMQWWNNDVKISRYETISFK